ncbi:threonine synthase [Alkaliflexus imshenetskii]|uniref:threonine synthase n=1 Tax=Alkaliflexus imshenetskii TaxID=286730 RepID=UPI00047A3DBD|nr:threonine synthase [Alkaliflexus imshenetskii]
MKYISLGSKGQRFSLKEVLFKGLAPDGSLFMPEFIPTLDEGFIRDFHTMELSEIAFHVLKPFVAEDVSDDVLNRIVKDTFSFEIPLKRVEDGVYALELYHGPTQAFKDVGARFLSRLLGFFNQGESRKLMVLTATSGDTGGAVAHGFHRVKGIEVVVLYPHGKVSPYQEYQITGPGDNVHAIAVNGSFDDCQRLVKDAFNDEALRQKIYMTSANSINMGRLLPQMVYYFYAAAQLRKAGIQDLPVFAVPSGNFGNITAAMLATKMGLPVKRFIAATNANDVVPRFLQSGEYDPQATIVTLANAMDVGDPSNFSRMYDLYNNHLDTLKNSLISISVSDAQIQETIKKVYNGLDYLMDPHTASAYFALNQLKDEDEAGIFVSTAHPFKFGEILEDLLPGVLEKSGYSIEFELSGAAGIDIMNPDYSDFKSRIEKMA